MTVDAIIPTDDICDVVHWQSPLYYPILVMLLVVSTTISSEVDKILFLYVLTYNKCS